MHPTQFAGAPGRLVLVETKLLAETLGRHADRGVERDPRSVGDANRALEVLDYAGDTPVGYSQNNSIFDCFTTKRL